MKRLRRENSNNNNVPRKTAPEVVVLTNINKKCLNRASICLFEVMGQLIMSLLLVLVIRYGMLGKGFPFFPQRKCSIVNSGVAPKKTAVKNRAKAKAAPNNNLVSS